MPIDYQDRRPIYEQIVDMYRNLILKGALQPDEQMPSVRSLAIELSANPNTVQKAYAELERQGFLYSVKGRGSFVCGNETLVRTRINKIAEEIEALIAEAQDMGTGMDELMEIVKKNKERRPDKQ